jgi:hypothetical protein
MKKSLPTLPFIVVSCKEATNEEIDTEVSKQGDSITKQVIQVAEFTGQQVTGVTVTSTERIFVNFPRWRKELKIQ